MLLDSETIAQAREEERSVREAYDRVPYPSASQHRTHPDHLAALAILHGLEPAPPDRCRVLELGCADGGNLVPMALEMPGSRRCSIITCGRWPSTRCWPDRCRRRRPFVFGRWPVTP